MCVLPAVCSPTATFTNFIKFS